MSPKVMYPQQQIYHITFGMNVINWHASTDNWAAAYRLLQNYMWASEDADQPAHHWSILWQCHIWSHWKKCIKSQVKETFKFALFGHSYKMFHLTLKLCPRWCSAPAPCLCTCIKSRKIVYKITNHSRIIFMKLAPADHSEKKLIWHKNSIPRVDMPLCYVQVCNHEKKCTRSQFTEILFMNFHQLAIMAKVFIRHQNSVPKGLSARAPGLCTCKKSQFNQICFRNLHQLATVTTGFIRHQNSVPKRWSAPVLRLPTCIKKYV